ncbi:MAG TPA: DNA-directed RNA polymerase subunit omega [Candidatus Coproplasma stercoravium]|nr:DNA-directed RNA polymerase subunit omega [Candidatus Coproplasma stercoravium]
MINKPAVDELIGKLSADGHDASRYELCVVVAKRARQIIEQMGGRELPNKMKEITAACYEIDSGKVTSAKD